MDTLTHALSGALLARLLCTRLDRSVSAPAPSMPTAPGRISAAWDGRPGAVMPWQAVVVGAVASAFPDIDSFTEIAGGLVYLQHHRGITHSLPLAPLWAFLLAWLMARCWRSLRAQVGGWKSLFPITLGGVLIHIAGDWITQFGTLLLAPFSDARFGLGAVFIIDLSLTGCLIAGLLLAALWPRQRWPAAVGLAAACAWVAVAWVGKQEALHAGAAWAKQQGVRPVWIESMPRPASPFNWTVVVFDGERYHLAHLNTRRSEPLVAQAGDSVIRRFSAPYLPTPQAPWRQIAPFGGPAAPAWVRDAWSHPSFAVYRWFALAPALAQAFEQTGPGGRPERCAVFRDLRFDIPGQNNAPFQYGVCLSPSTTGGPLQARTVKRQGDQLLAL
jgi:inner membrane protein